MSVTDAYDYTDQLRIKLISSERIVEVSREFWEIKDNAERVKFVESQLLEYDLMPTNNLRASKDEQLAQSLRKSGTIKYTSRKFLHALEFYNKSLQVTPEKSENMAVIYANRSAVFYELKLYDKCIENIHLAMKYNYKDLDRLKLREQKCHEVMKINDSYKYVDEQISNSNFLQLSYKSHKKLPFIGECLELKESSKFGRYVVANTKLRPGEIVAIEEPFSKCLIRGQSYKYCCNCLRDNCLNLIPCRGCTKAMFCSDKCLDEGWKKFHRYECCIIDKLYEICTKILRIAVHTFFEALDVYNHNILDLMNAMNEIDDYPTTVFDHDLREGGGKRSRILASINSLMTNESERNASDHFQRAGIVAIVTHLFLNHTKLTDVLTTPESQDFFRKFVFKQTQISAINYHGIFDGVMEDTQLSLSPQFASGSYPFCSLINHSCAPNIVRVSYNCKNYVMVNRPIKAGEQLFDNYGFHHCLEDRHQRNESLYNQYMFKCLCEACKNDYPLYHNLPQITKDLDNFLGNDIAELMELNANTAKNRVKEYCDYIEKFDESYPCHEVSTLQECLLRCSFIFKLTPFKLKMLEN